MQGGTLSLQGGTLFRWGIHFSWGIHFVAGAYTFLAPTLHGKCRWSLGKNFELELSLVGTIWNGKWDQVLVRWSWRLEVTKRSLRPIATSSTDPMQFQHQSLLGHGKSHTAKNGLLQIVHSRLRFKVQARDSITPSPHPQD